MPLLLGGGIGELALKEKKIWVLVFQLETNFDYYNHNDDTVKFLDVAMPETGVISILLCYVCLHSPFLPKLD